MFGDGFGQLSDDTDDGVKLLTIVMEEVNQLSLEGDLRLVSEGHFIVHRRLVSQTCFLPF